MVQILKGAEWTFYASCTSELGEETKNTERRPTERLLKDYCKLQPLTHITNVNHLRFTGNSTMGRRKARQNSLLTLVLLFTFYQFGEQ